MKPVLSSTRQVLTALCPVEYSTCLFQGSCLIEQQNGETFGVSFYKYDKSANQSLFLKSAPSCPYGYGLGKVSPTIAGTTCLIPYVSIAADPLEHTLGDVIFIPQLKGAQLPDGKLHDGYLIVMDYAVDFIGSGPDHFRFFTGTQGKSDPANPLISLGLTDPANTYSYQTIDGDLAETIRLQKGFKIIKTSKHQFREQSNSMIEGR